MRLFHYPQTCATAAHIVLEETGAPYDLHTVNIRAGEHRTPEYLAINPKGKIPALEAGGQIITENVAIHYYLARAFPERKLYPAELALQADWISISSFISNSLHIAGALVTVSYHYADDEAVYPSLHRKGKAEFAKFFKVLDKRLEGREWLVGDHYTTADAYLMAYVSGLRRFDVPLDEIPHVKQWAGRMLERPAVRRALAKENNVVLGMDELRAP